MLLFFSDYQRFIWFKDIVAMSYRLKPGVETKPKAKVKARKFLPGGFE